MPHSTISTVSRQHEPPISLARLTGILAVFTVVLVIGGTDMTKVAVALPELTEQLSLGPVQALWVADAYALTTGIAIIPSAVLADRYGRRRAYLAGLTVAMASALLAGTAADPTMLIIGRIGQGVGSALLIAATVAIIRVSFPTERSRAFAYGLWVSSFSAGVGLGPLLGGVLVEHLPWAWIFWVNAPVLGLCLLAAALVLPESRNAHPPGLDPFSIGSSTIGIAALILALKSMPRDDSVVIAPALLLGGAVALTAFCVRQLRLRRPYLDVALFKNPVLAVSALSIAATTGLFNGTLYLLTQQLQLVDERSGIEAGLVLLPLAAASVLGGVLSPGLKRWISEPYLLISGFLCTASGALLLISLPQTAHPASLMLLGLGAGTVMAIASNALMSSAPTTRTADAGAIQESAFALGAGMGIATLGVLSLHFSALDGDDLGIGIHSALGVGAFIYACLAIPAALISLARRR
ncbi:MFS transporter [Nesterenkonia sp. LB17]|uniref:MFS transporter n=1 Tax=unclassified Nesterenkonia TaxID=2629769 RepID=UPI001F4D0BB4|nr:MULTISPECIES: MFS transporter [unclassified Nesterenkonia]MCH8559655.1 MFS transporter [Nesterenkonia sp. DZ6]MCH8564637.1 MFS transporter [Nesterenkonia sp. LB17]MCH8570258.1 MFS transporter [Nesterenkonia sp. AY15]